MRVLYKPHGLKLYRRVVRVSKFFFGKDPAGQMNLIVEKKNGNRVTIPVPGTAFDYVLSWRDKRKGKKLADFRGIDGPV